MRRIHYSVATSLDGYVAGPNGEVDWIVMDPEIDFGALMGGFDTVLMGRKTFEAAAGMGGGAMPGMKAVVASRTLRPEDHGGVTVIGRDLAAEIDALRAGPGKDVWLFSGGDLFRSLLALGRVDAVELTLVPVLLGGGRSFLPAPADRAPLRLTGSRVYEKTGLVALTYDVLPPTRRKARRP